MKCLLVSLSLASETAGLPTAAGCPVCPNSVSPSPHSLRRAPGKPPGFPPRDDHSPCSGLHAALRGYTQGGGPQRHCRFRIFSPFRVSALPAPQELARRFRRVWLPPGSVAPCICVGAVPCSLGCLQDPDTAVRAWEGREGRGQPWGHPAPRVTQSSTLPARLQPWPKPPVHTAGPSRRALPPAALEPAKRCL